ncbi:MAG TPA: hypothetical protein VF693_02650, partial [Allosphingosinicella sp.]
MNLKRALLTVRLEPPLEIERNSVARSIPESETELKRIRVAKEVALSSVEGKLSLNPTALAGALMASGSQKREVTGEDELRVIQHLPETLVSPRPGGPREYSWELEPTYRDSLRGQPWDPTAGPRLRVKALSALPPLLPTVKIEVSCSLCDIEIKDIKLKSSSVGQSVKSFIFHEANEAAAVQHLKLVLRDADLE